MKIYRKIRSFLQPYFINNCIPDPVVNLNCTEFEVNNWIISDFIVSRLIPIVGTHPYPLCELMLMVSAVCKLKPTIIFEWGTNIGKSARIFHETSQYLHINTLIHTIDLPRDKRHPQNLYSQRALYVIKSNHILLHEGDGLTTALRIWKNNSGNQTVLFFLDGDHSYASVRKELYGIVKNIPNAHILVHDTFYQSQKSGYNIGPYQAVQEFLRKHRSMYHVYTCNLGLPGMVLMVRKHSFIGRKAMKDRLQYF